MPLINPFNELLVTETIPADTFVQMFSEQLIASSMALYQPGNVVLTGTPGCGKSMLLALLKPEIRLAYARQSAQLPLPEEVRNFIGAGINFRRSAALDFSNRPIMEPDRPAEVTGPLYFADFVNYWIARDIINSFEVLATSEVSKSSLGLKQSDQILKNFATKLSADPCWFGYLDNVSDFEQLRRRLTERISCYRSYFNYNIDDIPAAIRSTKTSIGEPAARVCDYLRTSGAIPEQLPVYVRVDQYEELTLMRSEDEVNSSLRAFKAVINKFIANRDPRISYKIGTRKHALSGGLPIYGTTAKLEQDRNFKLIDIDEILRRKERASTWLFPKFAENVFERRLDLAGYRVPTKGRVLRSTFGSSPSLAEKARRLSPGGTTDIVGTQGISKAAVDALEELAAFDPMEAKLGEAWIRQKCSNEAAQIEAVQQQAWRSKRYWCKERLNQGLLQIASSRRQRLIWSGYEDLLTLSGSNILNFLSICQQIWSAMARATPALAPNDLNPPKIPFEIQDEGIYLASRQAFLSISDGPDGHSRQRFARHVAAHLRSRLLNDRKMSNPGQNGFSIEEEALESQNDVLTFLRLAVDFGDLIEYVHTTKRPDKRARQKFYLGQLLSPFFQIPAVHTKEPLYASVETVREWMHASDISTDYERELVQESLFADGKNL